MAGEPEKLAMCVTSHAWNADRSRLAYCPNNNEVHIAKKEGDGWVTEHVLKEHDQVVTGIDWAPKTNRIVTCSQDRNAYVWTFQEAGWKPTLVILRLNRAATSVKWSPDENKFAVASGAKCVSVCYFEEDNDWWVSKHIKKHKSTVLQVDWHPNNYLLATGSSDYKARVFSAYIKNVDKKGEAASPWGEKPTLFGNLLAEFSFANGWIHTVSWSPSGNRLAFAGHDSSLSFVDVSSGAQVCQQLLLQSLPFRDIQFLNENTIVAVGHDCFPQLFAFKGAEWVIDRNLDEGDKKVGKAAAGSRAAFDKFQSAVDKGTKEGETIETILPTKHQNAINCIRAYRGAAGAITEFTTSAMDGCLAFWRV